MSEIFKNKCETKTFLCKAYFLSWKHSGTVGLEDTHLTLNSPEITVRVTYISRKLFEPKNSFDFCEGLRSLKFPKVAI